MSLKITLTLLIGLVVESFAAINDTAPGFSFTRQKNANHQLSINAPRGKFHWPSQIRNLSVWSLLPGNDSQSISQKTLFPVLQATYKVDVTLGTARYNRFYLLADLKTAGFNVSLTASGNDECRLDVTVSPPEVDVSLQAGLLDVYVKAYENSAVWKEFESAVREALAEGLPAFLTECLAALLPDDKQTLCEQILGAKPGAIPEPKLSCNVHTCDRLFSRKA